MGVFHRGNFTFDIDEKLKLYSVNHGSGLKNHELMNIMLNHIKNSLEAGASALSVYMESITEPRLSLKDTAIVKVINYTSRMLPDILASMIIVVLQKSLSRRAASGVKLGRIAIIDNGGGVPSDFVKNVFTLNSSTKKKNGVIRGAGMYLNREILRSAFGDVWIYKTGRSGTTIILEVPISTKK